MRLKFYTKNLSTQLTITRSGVKELLKDFLVEVKGVKYQKTRVITFREEKENVEGEFVPVYFNSNTKTVTNGKGIDIALDNAFSGNF